MRIKFARRLHALAERADKSNNEIAAACGVNPAAVGHWMNGRDVPSIDLWPAIAKVLRVQPRDLVPED